MNVIKEAVAPDPWLGVELRHLAALDAVESEGSFGRAAIKLGYTQSAVSQQIATLERIVGEQLIERPGGPRPVALTEAGQLLLRHARAIVAPAPGGPGGHRRPLGRRGRLAARRRLPERRRAHPAGGDAPVHPGVAACRDRAAGVPLGRRSSRKGSSAGSSTCSFVQLPLEKPGLETFLVLQDDYVLVSSKASSFAADGRQPSLREIAEQPLIGYRNCRATEIVVGQLRSSGREPHFVFRSDDNGVVQGLAGAGIGVAILPRLAIDPNDDTVRLTTLSPRIPRRQVGIARHQDRYHSPAARAFVATALEVGAEASVELAAY